MPKKKDEDKENKEDKLPSPAKGNKLRIPKIIYDGINCEKKTEYQQGISINDIKPEHKHLIQAGDII